MFKNELLMGLLLKNRDFKDGGAKGMIVRHYRKGLAVLLSTAIITGLLTMPALATEDVDGIDIQTEATSSKNEDEGNDGDNTDTVSQASTGSSKESEESEDSEESKKSENSKDSGDTVSGGSVSEDDLPTQSDGSKPVSLSFPDEYTYRVDSSEWTGKSYYNAESKLHDVELTDVESHEWAYTAMLAAADGTADDLVEALFGEQNDPLECFNNDSTTDKTGDKGYGNAAIASFVLANSTSANGIKGQLNQSAMVPIDDITAIKGLIYKYGSAVIDTYMDMSVSSATAYRTNSENYMFTTVSDDYADPNHSVIIYGWDDNLDADDFANRLTGKKPSTKGGFLAKGLTGEEFYISYEDATFTAEAGAKKRRAVAFDFTAGEKTSYTNMYAYDGTANVETKEVNMIANVFSASANRGKLATRTVTKTVNGKSTKVSENYITTTWEAVKQVGFAVADAGRYEVSVYSYPYDLTKKASPFTADNLIETVRADVNYAGYVTVKLDKPILITEGRSFAVVVRRQDGLDFDAFVSKTDGSYNWIGFEDNGYTKGYSSKTYVSFYKNDIMGDTYVAAYTPRIKVFTDNVNSLTKVSANAVTVTLPHYIYKHTGKNISPKVIVEANGYLMNSDSGLFTRVILGCKDEGVGHMLVSSNAVFSYYQGVTFQIVSSKGAKISKAKVYGVQDRALDEGKDYDQSDILLRYKMSDGTWVPLIEGVDYAVTSGYTGKNQDKKNVKMTIEGKGAFRKTKKVSFKVYDKITPIADSSIEVTMTYENKELENFEELDYTGTKIKPTIVVKDKSTGTTLTENSDYKVSYRANKNPGLARVIIKVKGAAKQSYKGKVEKFFIIKPINIAGGKLTDKCSSGYRYTGSSITPSVNVAVKKKNAGNSSLSIYTKNNTSVQSKSYSKVASRPTAYIFGAKKYTGYVGTNTKGDPLYYTILTATTTSSS